MAVIFGFRIVRCYYELLWFVENYMLRAVGVAAMQRYIVDRNNEKMRYVLYGN